MIDFEQKPEGVYKISVLNLVGALWCGWGFWEYLKDYKFGFIMLMISMGMSLFIIILDFFLQYIILWPRLLLALQIIASVLFALILYDLV